MFTSASQGILSKDCVTFFEYTVWFWHSSSWNFTGICFTHPCPLLTCSFSEFHKTSWMKRIPLWQHPSIVSQAENDLWTHVLWRQSLVQLPGTFFLGSHVSIWSTKQRNGRVVWTAANIGRQPRGLLGKKAICCFCVAKLGERERCLLQVNILLFCCSFHSVGYSLTSLTTCVIFLHMSFLCSTKYAIYENLTWNQKQSHRFWLGISLASQNKLLAKFQKERKHSEKMENIFRHQKNKTRKNTTIV